ncbi:MAG: class I SAM-dependent methyltransferase [Euryarchaeota archaeon]|nr:class I SAM-dependent methyltransferase [Euryarchaeota archaeon]MBU4032164.1 class I SAM-dependent methyltransferase [Candidatus Thermoplasmatota archaeon]MBU4072300.1 class I SAM-dependent methyltransferase [Candidatus Thermoplasmatota archaeon]MBU4143852.1 class I SAM-dependent methyltransferase [Candidatus Thermoplasmatota archaeon]
MKGERKKNEDAVREANIRYHTALANTYDQTQPNFKEENVAQVRERLKRLAEETGGKRLLDIGCGTGFMLTLAAPYFDEVYGIDITPAMLDLAKIKMNEDGLKNVKFVLAPSEKLPFEDAYFDVVTAYGVLHHLPNLARTFKEARRVMKPNGVFYSDEDPNYYFWSAIKALPENVTETLAIERRGVCQMGSEVRKVVGNILDDDTIEMAEYHKMKGGFKEKWINKLLMQAGFSTAYFEYKWFWQEGKVMRDISPEVAIYFEKHLRSALPITRNFFKYLRIEARA